MLARSSHPSDRGSCPCKSRKFPISWNRSVERTTLRKVCSIETLSSLENSSSGVLWETWSWYRSVLLATQRRTSAVSREYLFRESATYCPRVFEAFFSRSLSGPCSTIRCLSHSSNLLCKLELVVSNVK